MESMVRGYHVFGRLQLLPCQKEGSNPHNPYAVAVMERGVTRIVCSLLTISWKRRYYLSELSERALEGAARACNIRK